MKLLMVCLGNICRSPTAHGVMQKMITNKGLENKIKVDSAGTGDYHIGEQPDTRSIAAAATRGYDLSSLRARQVEAVDFERFDYILAMDRYNLRDLKRQCPSGLQHKLSLLLDYAGNTRSDGSNENDGGDGSYESNEGTYDAVPDPYHGGGEGFELVLDLVEEACAGLLETICAKHLAESGEAK
ncbi:MAG: low molecular weight protein-tyrosine-phosphatase [Pseudohongiellaceae bacterium]